MFHKVLSFFFKTPLSEVETKIWSAVEVWLVKNGYVDVFPWEKWFGLERKSEEPLADFPENMLASTAVC